MAREEGDMGFEELQRMLATVSRAAMGARGAAELAEVFKRRVEAISTWTIMVTRRLTTVFKNDDGIEDRKKNEKKNDSHSDTM